MEEDVTGRESKREGGEGSKNKGGEGKVLALVAEKWCTLKRTELQTDDALNVICYCL